MSSRDPYFLTHKELVGRLRSSDPVTISEAAREFGKRRPGPEIRAELRNLLSHHSPLVRTAAIGACANLDDRSAITDISNLLSNKSETRGVRETAAYALGVFGAAESRDLLLAVIAETNAYVGSEILNKLSREAAEVISLRRRIL